MVSSSSSESERGGVGARTLEVEPVGLPRFLKGREDMGRRRGAWGGERGDSLFWFRGVRVFVSLVRSGRVGSVDGVRG